MVCDDGISRNGTFVNNDRISGRRRLRDGDVIRVGRTMLVCINEATAEQRDRTTIMDAMSATGTVTLLFTDLVGSTALLERLGDDAGDRFLRDHFSILREAISEHRGQEVKSLGDGLMVAFPSALSAVACTIGMQQRMAAYTVESGSMAIGLRIGLNAGEVISAGGDYAGTPVIVAKRLCDRAGAGQTLLSDVVRALVGSRGDYPFIALGPLQLKGFADPVQVCELDWRMHSSKAPSRSS